MSLDVGVVTVDFIEPLGESVHDFLIDLLLNLEMGMNDSYENDWDGSWDGNSLYELGREKLINRASQLGGLQGYQYIR